MELVKKDIQFETKAAGSRSFWITASTEDVDRDGDRILSEGWHLENFKKNPVIPWAHKYDQPPVAKALQTKVQDKKLKLLIELASAEEYPFADTIYRLYNGKFLNAFSVGFNPMGRQRVERLVNGRKITGYDYLEAELWEVSACTVPSNPNALVSAKKKGVITAAEFKSIEQNGSFVQLDFGLADLAIMIGDRLKKRIDRFVADKANTIIKTGKF